ncbi:hypothetical protein CN998_01495 [Bacillus cereus]|nr:hypothetical protein CN998_01495 [Bacillus cereus]PGU50708.1 hypothetical protein COD70_29250 [Bacillus cereus]
MVKRTYIKKCGSEEVEYHSPLTLEDGLEIGRRFVKFFEANPEYIERVRSVQKPGDKPFMHWVDTKKP